MLVLAKFKSLEMIQEELRQRLAREIGTIEIAAEIQKVFKEIPKGQTREQVALTLAQRLNCKWPSLTSPDLRLLIERRPTELAAVLDGCDWDVFLEIAKKFTKQPRPKSTRANGISEAERKRNLKTNKNYYEKSRRNKSSHGGVAILLEQFGLDSPAISLSNPFNQSPPTGPCLDNLLNGGEVKMAGEVLCLQTLFGVNRHRLPKSLSCVRRGRETFYDLGAFMKCLISLLNCKVPHLAWLPDADQRNRVLTGVIRRARDSSAGPELADILERLLRPYLT
jgi:hypothetical protein